MVRVYARENATQRGQQSTALAGSVASALMMVAKGMFTGSDDFIRTDQARHELGYRPILKVLEKVPGITINAIKDQLANLKDSGHYARIIQQVEKEIEEENR